MAEFLHLPQFVGDEDHRAALLLGQAVQGLEEEGFLWGGDAGGGLVQDDDLRVQRQEAQYLQLLPLADGQAGHLSVGVQVELEAGAQLPQQCPPSLPVREHTAVEGQQEVVQHPHLGEVQGGLVQHSDPMLDGFGGGGEGDRLPVHLDGPAVGGQVTGEALHQRRFTGPILP